MGWGGVGGVEQSKCLNDRLTTSLNEERLQSVAATEQTSGSQRSSLPLAFFHHQPLRPELIPTRLTRVYSFTVVSANFTAVPLVFHCLLPPPRHQPSASQAASSSHVRFFTFPKDLLRALPAVPAAAAIDCLNCLSCQAASESARDVML